MANKKPERTFVVSTYSEAHQVIQSGRAHVFYPHLEPMTEEYLYRKRMEYTTYADPAIAIVLSADLWRELFMLSWFRKVIVMNPKVEDIDLGLAGTIQELNIITDMYVHPDYWDTRMPPRSMAFIQTV
jgi:hypothetical protein